MEGKKTYSNNIPTVFSTSSNTPRKSPAPRIPESNPVPEPKITPPTCTQTLTSENDSNTDNDDIQQKLKDKILELQAKQVTLQAKYDEGTNNLHSSLFQLKRFMGSDIDFKFYTGFPNYSSFKAFYEYLSPACEHLIYLGSNTAPQTSDSQSKCGRARSMSPEQELFLVLVRLRLGLLLQDLAHRYNISTSQVSRIFKTWIVFLHQCLRALPIWPSRKFIDDNMPPCFKLTYPKTRVIIDCTEIFIEMPSSCRSQSITF
mgnify:FL=1